MDNNLEREYNKLQESLGFYFGRVISYPLIPPEHVYFSLTNRCNLRCKMCGIPQNSSEIEDGLSITKIKDITLQIKEMRIKHLIFFGGEPLLKEGLVEIVEFATAKDIEMVDIITNGILLSDDIIQKLIRVKLNHITTIINVEEDIFKELRLSSIMYKDIIHFLFCIIIATVEFKAK